MRNYCTLVLVCRENNDDVREINFKYLLFDKKILKTMQVFFIDGQYNSRPVQQVLKNLLMKGAFTHEEKAINANRWLIAIGYVPCWLRE
jgi:hypothetical protein